MIQAKDTDTAVPITLAINDAGGKVTGESPTVQVRDPSSGQYLDFNDLTFKGSGWTTKNAALAELEAGFYALSGGLDVSGFTQEHLVLEFTAGVNGATEDLLIQRLSNVIDAAVDLKTVLQRLNSYARGRVVVTDLTGNDKDVAYYAEDDATPLFTNQKTDDERIPQ